MVGYLVFLDEAPVKAVDRGSTVNEGFGDDVFVKVFLRADREM